MDKINVSILGASGYTGAELLRLLSNHPYASVCSLSADRKAGHVLKDIFPHFSTSSLGDKVLQKIDDIDFSNIDLVFCCLPHGLTQEIILKLPSHLKIIDLSADFRFKDPQSYAYWYQTEHKALDLQEKFIYGLSEFYRDQIKGKQYIANTGCYVASSLLALLPILDLIDTDDIIIDAKSGVSGAGRSAKENLLFTEISEGFSAYSIQEHRHAGEINQELSLFANKDIKVTFTPHLIPQNRGILSTIYVELIGDYMPQDLYKCYQNRYHHEPFIHLMPFGAIPSTHMVKGSNHTLLGISPTSKKGQVKIISVLDNLIKGASGQAIQNMNILFGFPETMSLQQVALFP